MRVLTVRTCELRNIHCHRPVIWARVDLETLAQMETVSVPGFNDRLLAVVPGLRRHHCSLGRPGGFVERLEQGTMFGHLVEHVALELQTAAGINVVYGKTRQADPPSVYDVIVECELPRAAICALSSAVELVNSLIAGSSVDLDQIVQAVAAEYRAERLGPSTESIRSAALQRDIPVIRLADDNSLLQLGWGCHQRRVWATVTDRTGCLGADIAADKMLAKRLLEQAGLPVPRGGVAASLEQAQALAATLGFPLAMKPCNGNQGKGVSLDLQRPEDIAEAYRLASRYSERAVIEEYIPGRHYRILVVGDEAIAASERIPARVTGTGFHTIKQLVDQVNADPMRGEGHELPLTRLRIDPVVLTVLARANRTVDDVPAAGEVVCLRQNANLSTGGTARDVTDDLHPYNRQLAERAARVVGLDIAGVDLVARDISSPITRDEGAVIEVNAAPGLRMHLYPERGEPRMVHERIVETMFPPESPARVPLVAVTGTNGKTSTVRLTAAVLSEAGYQVGTCTTDGVEVNGSTIAGGDLAGPGGCRMVLTDPRVEAAVVEVARGGLVREGLGYDRADVAIVTNVQEDHLGQHGVDTLTDMVFVKSLVAEAVDPGGAVVLNADDPASQLIVERTRAPVIYVSLSPSSPIVERSLANGGRAVITSGGKVIVCRGDTRMRLASAASFPVTHGGRCEAGIANVLCAIAAGLGLGLDLDAISRGAAGLLPTLQGNRGRMNLLQVDGRTIIVDYGHNPAAFSAVARLARRVANADPVTAVVGVPGDRTDQQIIASGSMAGRLFDVLYIREDADLRGRKAGETARLLALGAQQAGVNGDRLRLIFDEGEAVSEAIAASPPPATVVVFYESLATVMDAIGRTCDLAPEPAPIP